eukprot:scaffold15965_cov111-Isochrysis_galbana.AAC.5
MDGGGEMKQHHACRWPCLRLACYDSSPPIARARQRDRQLLRYLPTIPPPCPPFPPQTLCIHDPSTCREGAMNLPTVRSKPPQTSQ